MTTEPLVSILCATYNQEKYLPACLESILKQTYNNWELLIVDDHSKDQSWEILQTYAMRDPRIKVYQHEHRKRLARSLNELRERAQGTFIARMDSDDVMETNRIQEQVNYLQKNLGVNLVASSASLIDESGKIIGIRGAVYSMDELKTILLKRNPLLHPTWLMRKTLWDDVKGYTWWFMVSQDYDFLVRAVARQHKIAILEKPLVRYRVTRAQKRWNYYYLQIVFMLLVRLRAWYYHLIGKI